MKQYLILLAGILFFSANANVTLPPGATISVNNTVICQGSGGTQVTFTGVNGVSPYTFNYTVNGNPQTITTTGTNNSINVTVNTANFGNVTYILTGITDSDDPPVTSNVSGSVTIQIKPRPDATLNGTGSGSIFNGTPVFRICSNEVSEFEFTNGSSTGSINDTYTINWGDSTPNYVSNAFTGLVTHTYQIGLWNLTYTITGNNGCSTTRSYIVFVGSNPAVSLGNPGNTDICISTPLTFPITGTNNNPPGTTYTVTFNDGSPPIVFNHPPPSSVTHTFLASSCGTTSSDGSNSYPNSFFANIVASNPCSISSVGVVPIYVSTPPLTDFAMADTVSCTNIATCFTNTSIGSENFGAGSSCDTTPAIIWTISPNTGYTLSSGSLGNDFGSTNQNIWTSGSQVICPVFTAPGIYTITLKAKNRCGQDIEVKTICIESPLTPQFTLSQTNGCTPFNVSATNTTSIVNSCEPPTYQWNVSYTAGNCGSGTPTWSFAGGTSATSANPNFNFVTPGTYSITLITTNGCGSVTSPAQTVIVKQPPTATIAAIADFCGSAAISPAATITNCAPAGEVMTYAWSFPGGSPALATTANPGTVTYANPGNYTVSLTVTNSCGSSTTATESFTVNVAPAITNSNLSQTICSGNATAAIPITSLPAGATYSWVPAATPGLTGFAPTGTAATIPAMTIINNGSAAGTVTYTITPTINGCSGPPVNYIITVNPAPSISVHPLPATVCQNAVMTPLTVSYTNGTGTPSYQWFSNNTPTNTGGAAVPGATLPSFTPPSTSVGVIYYYVTVSLPTGGCSNLTSNVAAITITAPVTISSQPTANQSICTGGSVPAFTVSYSGGTGSASYQWYSNTSATNSGGILIPGANADSFTPPAFNTVGNYYYYAVVTVSGSGCNQAVSDVAAVNVLADPVIAVSPATQTLCQGALANVLTATASGGLGTFTYQWYSNTTNNNTTGTAIPTATSQTYTPSTMNVGTIYHYVIASQPNSGCSAVSATVQITVIAAPTITSQPQSSTVCLGGTPTVLSVTYSNGIGTPGYQWYSNVINSTTGGTLIPGATNATFNPPSATSGILYYYVIISLPSGGCSQIVSATAAVEVAESITVTDQPGGTQTICIGGTIPPITVGYSGGTGNATYQWYSNTTLSNTGGSLIPGAISASYTPPAFTAAGNFYYYVEFTLSGAGCGTTASDIAEVIVVPDPVIMLQPLASQTVCADATPADLVANATGGVGAISYQWFSNTSNSTSGGTTIPSATNPTFTPPTSAIGTLYYYVIATAAGSGCAVTSTTAEVIVNPSPAISQQPSPATVCQGGVLQQLTVVYINGTGAPAYQWYVNSVDNTSSGTSIPGATNATFTPPSTDIGIQYYYVIISLPPSGGCDSITSQTAAIEITPGTSIDTQPLATQSLCAGGQLGSPLTISYSGGTGTPSYQWFSNTVAVNSGGVLIPGATTASYLPPVFSTAGTFYYYAVVSLSGTGCGPASSDIAEVVVVADPVIDSQPIASQSVCQGATADALQIIVSGGVGTVSYQWFSNTSASNTGGTALSGANANSFTPDTSTVGSFWYYVEVSQTGSGCSVASDVAAIIVNLAPSFVDQPQSQTLCEGATADQLSVTFINGTGTPMYQWFSNTVADNTSGTAVPGATSSTFTPPASLPGILFYYNIITLPSTGGCSAITSGIATITVTELPFISTQPLSAQSICVGGALTDPLEVGYTGGTGTATYQWFSNTTLSNSGGTAITGATSASYSPPPFNSTGTFYFYAEVTLEGLGCGSAVSDVATVTVVEDPVITTQPLATQEICQNALAADLLVTASGGVPGSYAYQWFASPTNDTASGAAIAGANSSVFSPPTDITGTVYYYVIVTQIDGSGCSVVSTAAEVTVNDAPSITMQPVSSTVCSGEAASVMEVQFVNGAGTPLYQWYSNSVNSTVGAVALPGETSSSFTPPSVLIGTIYYYVIISLPDGGCPDMVSDIASVNVNANPIISDFTEVICSGNPFNVIPDGTNGDLVPTGTTYTWGTPVVTPAGSVDGSAAETTPQTLISQTLINTTSSVATVVYTVTPVSGLCVGADFTVTVTVNPSINPNVSVSNSTCYDASNGSIETNITGGIPFPGTPYQILWTGPGGFSSTDASIYNLAPGVYNVTITDAGGCPYGGTFTITEPDELIIGTDLANDITCYGDNDGAISVTLTGGTLPYIYTWTKNSAAFASTEDIANLGPGVYSLSVTDANNCAPATISFTIVEPPLLTVSLLSQTNILCYGAATGAVSVNVGGGIPVEVSPGVFSYNFSWSGPNGFTSSDQDLSGLVAGTYDLTISDQNGCFQNLSVTITQNPEIVLTAATTPITCYGANNASISLTVSGGMAPYQAAWDNLATGFFQDNLSAGTYVITVTDALNCQQIISVVIPEAPVFTTTPVVTQISCHGANDGSIQLNLMGGIAPVVLTWSDGSNQGTTRNNLPPGTYTAVISDGTPCYITQTFTIVEPAPLVVSANVQNALACGNAASGSIDLTVNGGTMPYSFSWSNGANTEDLSGLTAGNYAVTVTDSRGCVATAQYQVTSPLPLVVDIQTQVQANCTTGEVYQVFTANVTGGLAPYNLTWSSGTVSGANGEIMTTNQSTLILFEVTDALGCTSSQSFQITNPVINNATFATTSTGYETYGYYSIVDPIYFTNNATGDYETISWNFGDGTFSTEENPVHSYMIEGEYVVTQTVTYPFGCVYTHVITLLVKKGYFLVVPNAFTPNEDSLNDNFRPVTKGLKNVKLTIYDTWGSVIYSEEGTILTGWNGVINNMPAENGNYYCKVSAETFYGTVVHENHPFVLIK